MLKLLIGCLAYTILFIALQAKPDVRLFGTKWNAVSSPTIYGNDNSPLVLLKRFKQKWICSSCHVTTTSEQVLNDHLQGKGTRLKKHP